MKSTQNEINTNQLSHDKNNIHLLIFAFIDYLYEYMQDNNQCIMLKEHLTEVLRIEMKTIIHENISTIISEHQQINDMKQTLIEKQNHIEQLELMIYELQALLRSKDENMFVVKDTIKSNYLNNAVDNKNKEFLSSSSLPTTFKNKITNFFISDTVNSDSILAISDLQIKKV